MKTLLVCAAVLAAGSVVRADLIGFETLIAGQNVTTQFPGVTFSSSPGLFVRVDHHFEFGTGLYVCSANTTSITCVDPIFLDFASPVTGVRFLTMGDDFFGTEAVATAFNGATLLGSVNVVVDGVFLTTDTVDLSSLGPMTRLAITNITDGGGLAFDEFQFTVPAPSMVATLSLGLATQLVRRRRRS